MALKFDWRYLDGAAFTDLSSYFRKYELEVMSEAEQGGTGTSSAKAYDPLAELDFIGLSHLRIWEMSAPEGSRCIWQGHIGRQEVRRGEYDKVAVQRIWDLSLDDLNAVLGRRIFNQSEAERPAETDIARLEWVLGTSQMSLVTDTTYVDDSTTSSMDAVDYRGQTPFSVLDDISQQSGKNFFVWYKEDTDEYGLWYARADWDQYSSTLRLSNDLADIDDTTTFAVSDDTRWTRDPTRVYAGVYLPYDGGAVMVKSNPTLFNYPRRDFVAPSLNVKTKTKALARALRYLNDLDTEEVWVTTTVLLPKPKVNLLMQGMRVEFKATHLPGFEDFEWVRILNRVVRDVSEDFYAVTIEAVVPHVAPPSPPLYGILRMAKGVSNVDPIFWGFPGDEPGIGYPLQPTVGLISPIQDLDSPYGTGWSYTGWLIEGTGTVDVTFYGSAVGVIMEPGTYLVTYSILLNGTVVASEVVTETVELPQQFRFVSNEATVSIADLAVVPDDVISAHVSCAPPMAGTLVIPGGTGQSGERLEITGGTLV